LFGHHHVGDVAMRYPFLLLMLVANAASGNYYKCVSDGYKTRWDGKPCVAGEVQTEYDSRTKQPLITGPQRPEIGMSAEQARALPHPWGEPKDVNRTTTASGVNEQWVYGERSRRYLYFTNGILTAISD